MEVPKYVQEAIKKAGRYTAMNKNNADIVRKWAMKQGLVDENFENLVKENVIDCIIDCIEVGVDSSSELIEFLNSL